MQMPGIRKLGRYVLVNCKLGICVLGMHQYTPEILWKSQFNLTLIVSGEGGKGGRVGIQSYNANISYNTRAIKKKIFCGFPNWS